MTLFQLNNLQAQIEGYIERHAEPPLTIIGDDTNANGFRVVVPNSSPTVCGDVVRALRPGNNMSIAVDASGNTLTLTSIVPQLESLVNATMNG